MSGFNCGAASPLKLGPMFGFKRGTTFPSLGAVCNPDGSDLCGVVTSGVSIREPVIGGKRLNTVELRDELTRGLLDAEGAGVRTVGCRLEKLLIGGLTDGVRPICGATRVTRGVDRLIWGVERLIWGVGRLTCGTLRVAWGTVRIICGDDRVITGADRFTCGIDRFTCGIERIAGGVDLTRLLTLGCLTDERGAEILGVERVVDLPTEKLGSEKPDAELLEADGIDLTADGAERLADGALRRADWAWRGSAQTRTAAKASPVAMPLRTCCLFAYIEDLLSPAGSPSCKSGLRCPHPPVRPGLWNTRNVIGALRLGPGITFASYQELPNIKERIAELAAVAAILADRLRTPM